MLDLEVKLSGATPSFGAGGVALNNAAGAGGLSSSSDTRGGRAKSLICQQGASWKLQLEAVPRGTAGVVFGACADVEGNPFDAEDGSWKLNWPTEVEDEVESGVLAGKAAELGALGEAPNERVRGALLTWFDSELFLKAIGHKLVSGAPFESESRTLTSLAKKRPDRSEKQARA
jgi:hypothetical protein